MTEEAKPQVTFSPDGPLVVRNVQDLRTSAGKIEAQPTMALCRCGASKKKPLCDGTHAKIGFSSKATAHADKDKRVTYTGLEITVHDNRSICAHAGYCTKELPSVFRMKQEPWIDPDGAKTQEILSVIHQCPSGALTCSVAGIEQPLPVGEASINVVPAGPYVVRGRAKLVDVHRAEGASEEICTLCRCGASKNKPFCDGTHWNVDFDEHTSTGA
jgi:CDGSH-type Zn-finger protein